MGHLVSVGKVAINLPRRGHPQQLVTQLINEYNLPPVFYLDNRPAAPAVLLVIVDP